MAYVTEEYYTKEYLGEPVDIADFPSLEKRASELVESMTMYRVTPITILAMPEDTKSRVMDAICAQIEYLEANGGSDLDNGTDLQSAALGKFNYSMASSGGSTKQSLYAPRAMRLLAPTGLLYRGGGGY